MRFVQIETDDQPELQALHRVRDRLVSRRTGVINQIRAFLLVRGISFREGPANLRREVSAILEMRKKISPSACAPCWIFSGRSGIIWNRRSKAWAGKSKGSRVGMQPAAACGRFPELGRLATAIVVAIGNGAAFHKGLKCRLVWGWCRGNTHRGQTETAGHQQAGKPLSAEDVHSRSASGRLASEARSILSGEMDQRVGIQNYAQCADRGYGE
jgi:hypothetical protein